MKACNLCRIPKQELEFNRNRSKPGGRDGRCRECQNKDRRYRVKHNIDGAGDRRRASQRVHRAGRPVEEFLFDSVKASAKLGDRELTISPAFLLALLNKQQWRCFYSGVRLVDVRGKQHPFKPSVDRKDSSKGYTSDNVVICAWAVNRMKSDMEEGDFVDCLNQIADSVFGKMWSRAA